MNGLEVSVRRCEIDIRTTDITTRRTTLVFPPQKVSKGYDFGGAEKSNPYESQPAKGKTTQKSKTPVLDNFGRDLTHLAENNKLDPVVGRKEEIERVSQILSRTKKEQPNVDR